MNAVTLWFTSLHTYKFTGIFKGETIAYMSLKGWVNVVNQSTHLLCQYDIFAYSVFIYLFIYLFSCMTDTLVMIKKIYMIFNQLMQTVNV